MTQRSWFGSAARFHHVGLVVESIDEVAPDADTWDDPSQRVRVAFVEADGVCIEYIEPLGDDSPVAATLRRGQKLAHLCFAVPDLERAATAARAHGFRRISRPVAALAFEGRRILWLFSRVHGLVELVEQPRS